MNHQRILALLLSLTLALSLAACGQQDDETQDGEPEGSGVPVQVQTIALDTIATENKVSGRIVAEDQAIVMVAVNAKCTAVYVDAGDTVQAGQTLCTLDLASTLASYNAATISYNAAVKSYEDQAAIFETQIGLLEKNLEDLKALFAIGAASQLEIDQAELTLLSTKAQRDSTMAQLEAGMQSYKSNVEQLSMVLENVDSRGNVIAPASGTLVSLSAVENGYVSASSPVAVIDGADQMKIAVSVSEALVPKLSVGDAVDVTVSALGLTFVGAVRTVEKSANMQTKLYTVTVSVPNDVTGLLSGMFADVTFRTDTSADTVVIPTEAILTAGGTQYVYVVEGDTARYVTVTTGLTGNGVTEVTAGLSAGQQLVIVGQAYLSDGETVRIVTGEGT